MKKILITALLFFMPLVSMALQPLTLDQAFKLSVKPVDTKTVLVQWRIAPGYHLYRERINIQIAGPKDARLGTVILPTGIVKQDNTRKYEIYEGTLAASVPVQARTAKRVILAVSYQGCADSGFCYPPTTKKIAVTLGGNAGNEKQLTSSAAIPIATANAAQIASDTTTDTVTAVASTTSAAAPAAATSSSQDKVSELLATKSWSFILLGFFGFGLLLAFTPCVLPMIPILSGIIVGQGEEINTLKAFMLALTYVLSMAVTYAIAGTLAGLAGNYVQAFLQSPWVIGIFSTIFVLLALSLFGFYELRIPNSWHHHVTHLSNKQTGGSYVGVAIMGCLSTLILSPCVTAPLIGALGYIGKTGNAVLGGSALFALGLGMGVPLIIIGTVGGKFLPRAGVWMHTIKAIFGVIMLGVAILLLSRILRPEVVMLLWAALLIVSAVYMGAFTTTPAHGFGKLWKGCSLIMLVYGFLLLIGAGMGNADPLQPLAMRQTIAVTNVAQSGSFKTVKGLQELKQALIAAKQQGKPVLLDFSAEWCVSCKQMDRSTFNFPDVQSALNKFVLLRADVTDNDASDRALQKRLNVIAPPTILVFDSTGREVPSARIVGEIGPQEFQSHLQSVLSTLQG